MDHRHRQLKAKLDGESLVPSTDKRRGISRLLFGSKGSLSPSGRKHCLLWSLFGLTCLFFLIQISSVLKSEHHAIHLDSGGPVVDDSIPIASEPRVLILQQTYPYDISWWSRLTKKSEQPLYEASIRSHAKYAKAWGYGYKLDTKNWLGRDDKRSKHLNKVYCLLSTVLEEMDKPEGGAEWIMFTDADTLILNPAIALSTMLPPASFNHQPLIMGNIDHRGFNAGVMLFRPSPKLASFLMAMLSNEPVLHAESEIHPSDQHLFGYTIQLPQHTDVAQRFYAIPQRWLNGYWIDEGNPALHIHLVNQRKWQENWRETVIGRADGIYERALRIGEEGGADEREVLTRGFESMNEWKRAKDAAESFWRDARGGIEGILFNEI